MVFGTILRTIERLGMNKDDVAMVSGIGCTGRMPVYADLPAMHTTHGRAVAFATGLKMALPQMNVIVVMGDGDAVGIGGNHFLHAARRNMDLTAIIVNNSVYGMTGGQCSPATPLSAKAATAPYGNIEEPFDIARVASAAGSAFVARTTTYHVVEMGRLLEQALGKKGFSVIEVISQCPTHYGKRNGAPTAVDMLRWQRDNSVHISALKDRENVGGMVRGVLADRDTPGYVERYRELITQSRKER